MRAIDRPVDPPARTIPLADRLHEARHRRRRRGRGQQLVAHALQAGGPRSQVRRLGASRARRARPAGLDQPGQGLQLAVLPPGDAQPAAFELELRGEEKERHSGAAARQPTSGPPARKPHRGPQPRPRPRELECALCPRAWVVPTSQAAAASRIERCATARTCASTSDLPCGAGGAAARRARVNTGWWGGARARGPRFWAAGERAREGAVGAKRHPRVPGPAAARALLRPPRWHGRGPVFVAGGGGGCGAGRRGA